MREGDIFIEFLKKTSCIEQKRKCEKMKNKSRRTNGEEGGETLSSLSPQTVASLDDLLIQILLRLPIKSLIRFKIVSKHWLSLISDPQFALRRLPNPNPAVGIFHFLASSNSFEYIPFDLRSNPVAIPPSFKNLIKSTENQSGVHILDSCNGLLLCSSAGSEDNYHLYNPTTKQLTTFPMPERCRRSLRDAFRGLTLAFDPVKSRHYKVVCVRALRPSYIYQTVIYSSETGKWKDSSEIFRDDLDTGFREGVYCNGRVHWISGLGKKSSLCFNVEEEELGLMPMPPIPDDWNSHYNVNYFGESCGCLHMIDIYGSQIQFNVYELKRDYSEWFVKYHVDLAEVANAFPALIRVSIADINCYSFSIFSIIRGEKEDDAFLVLRIPGKVIRYNLLSKTFEKLCDFEGGDDEDYLKFYDLIAYQYIESLCYF